LLAFSTENGQPSEAAACQLYRHSAGSLKRTFSASAGSEWKLAEYTDVYYIDGAVDRTCEVDGERVGPMQRAADQGRDVSSGVHVGALDGRPSAPVRPVDLPTYTRARTPVQRPARTCLLMDGTGGTDPCTT